MRILCAFVLVSVSGVAAAKIVDHAIKSGETLYTVAHGHHTTIKEVRALNHIQKGEILKIGRVLKVPVDTYFPDKTSQKRRPQKSGLTDYTVVKGDTLYGIAKKYSTTITALTGYNHITSDATLKPGQTLRIPNRTAQQRALQKAAATKAKKIILLAKEKLGRKYVWGATGNDTFDCSGLTSYVYKKNGIRLPRRAIAQSRVGKEVSRNRLRPGDLVFFDTSKEHKGYVNHVGIYIGHGKFIHASSAKKKVIITSLSKPFYARRFKLARRYTATPIYYASAR